MRALGGDVLAAEKIEMKAIIYRIQDASGRGPFKPGFTATWLKPRADHDNLAPWFVEMGPVHTKVRKGMACGCGCQTVEQLRRWFSADEYLALLAHGYKAVKLEADRLLGSSATQCVFERAHPLHDAVEEFSLYDT